ncbi:MAG TPA: hypothetical protein VFA58_09335 [Chthoniobacterales bacterium]|nr:hypothetical protein [Chthoniobacterales bacterium]
MPPPVASLALSFAELVCDELPDRALFHVLTLNFILAFNSIEYGISSSHSCIVTAQSKLSPRTGRYRRRSRSGRSLRDPMKIESHIEKFRRFDRQRSRLDPKEDFELWYWMSLSGGTALVNAALHAAGLTREHDSFASQIPDIYSVAGTGDTRRLAYMFGVDIIHVGMPEIDKQLPSPIEAAFSAMKTIEAFRDPCIREDRAVTDDVIATCSRAYANCVGALKQVVAL